MAKLGCYLWLVAFLCVCTQLAAAWNVSLVGEVLCPPIDDREPQVVNLRFFSWCKEADVGRVVAPFELNLTRWDDQYICSDEDFMCKSVMQFEAAEIEDLTITFMTFYSDPTVIVSGFTLTMITPHPNNFFNVGYPIKHFHLIHAPQSQSVTGILATLENNNFAVLTFAAKKAFPEVTSREFYNASSIVGITGRPGNLTQIQVITVDELSATYIVYVVDHLDGSAQVLFAPAEDPMNIVKSINIKESDSLQHLSVSSFVQTSGGSEPNTRRLLLLHDMHTLHILGIPGDANPHIQLQWNDTASSFLHTSNQLKKVIAYSEATLRDELQVPYVWLMVYDTHPFTRSSNVFLVMLPEFSSDWLDFGPGIDNVTNPAGRPLPTCSDPNQTDTSGTCVDRYIMSLASDTDSEDLPDIEVRNIPAADLLGVLLPGLQNSTTSSLTALFIGYRDQVMVYVTAPVVNETYDIYFEHANTFNYMGKVETFTVSSNGYHLFGTVSRNSYEMISIERYYNICTLALNPSGNSDFENKMLEPWTEACKQPHRRPIVADYLQYVSMCPYGTYCYSVNRYVVGGIFPGMYASSPIQIDNCPPGSFCPFGEKKTCPRGFICPEMLMVVPRPCPKEAIMNGMTCFEDGLVAPIPAPLGTIPLFPQAPAFPAAPGTYAQHFYPNGTGLIAPTFCAEGEYCPLGRDGSQDRACPAGTYCPHTTDILPILCSYNVSENYCSYCPAGSTKDLPCPAGYQCPRPDSREVCINSYYCPPGTMSQRLCPPGFYCPTPSQKIICPRGHYCELGSQAPVPCAILSYCPAGTKNNAANFILALVFVLAIIALVVVWKVVDYRTDKQRKEHSQAIQAAERLLQQSKLSNNALLLDSIEDESDGLVTKKSRKAQSPQALASLINDDMNTKMPPLNFTVDISFKELGLKIKGTDKKVLDGVTGTIRHGRVTAVMGPSGAGKTTFMSTLANKAYYGDRIGEIYINNHPADITSLQSLVGFVPQEDVMLRELSVTEILEFNARMRLPVSMSDEEKMDQVRKTTRLLGLYDIRHELIGDESKRGISGGQRKRVNIGMELVAQPTVLFLDEPTSGLDSSSSLEVCGVLRRVAEEAGLTVIAVIHQPRYDIFTMFHDVLLLGKGGRTVYLGPTKDAVAYFANLGFEVPAQANPADFLIDVVSGAVPRQGHPNYVKEDLFTLWTEHCKARGNVEMESDEKAPTYHTESELEMSEDESEEDERVKLLTNDPRDMPFKLPAHARRKKTAMPVQFIWFFLRSLVQQKRNWISILTDVILVVVSAVTFGIVFLNSQYIGPPSKEVCNLLPVPELQKKCLLPIDDPIPQIALMTTIGLALPAAMAALRVFGPERVVFWRESSAGANTLSYYLGKELGFLPSSILLPLLYAGVFYNFTVPRMNFGILYLVFLATWWCSTGLSIAISILVPPNLATISTVVVVFGMSMFSGVRPTLIELKKMWPPFSLISYVSFFRWLTEAFYVSEIFQWRNLYSIESGLKIMNYHLDNFGLAIGLVIMFGFAFRIIAFASLELLNRDQRK